MGNMHNITTILLSGTIIDNMIYKIYNTCISTYIVNGERHGNNGGQTVRLDHILEINIQRFFLSYSLKLI